MSIILGGGGFVGMLAYLDQKKMTEYQRKTYEESIDRERVKILAKQAMLGSVYKKDLSKIKPYIDRRTLESSIKMKLMDNFIEADMPDAGKKPGASESVTGYSPSFVICGPRGCGKSVIMANIVKDTTAVVPISYRGSTDKEFIEAVFQSLNINLPSNTKPETFLREVLLAVNETKKPTFLVEVDKRFGSSDLENLLLLLKTLGDDSKLLLPIVVLSSSHSAFGLDIDPVLLRTYFIDVTDLTHDETWKFFNALLMKLGLPEHEKEEEIKFAIENIGNRLTDLHTMAKQLPTDFTLEIFRSVVKEYHEWSMMRCRLAFAKFRNKFPHIQQDKLLKRLERGLILDDLCKELKCDTSEFLTANSNIQPHVFYVSPTDSTVTLASKFMVEFIKNIIKN